MTIFVFESVSSDSCRRTLRGEPQNKCWSIITILRSEVQKLLENLRDAPVGTDGLSDTTLLTIYDYLMFVTPKSGFITFHWFCNEANPTTVEAATFLLRLLAYDQKKVDEWKTNYNLCLSRCAKCVFGLEKAKVESMDTYVLQIQEFVIV